MVRSGLFEVQNVGGKHFWGLTVLCTAEDGQESQSTSCARNGTALQELGDSEVLPDGLRAAAQPTSWSSFRASPKESSKCSENVGGSGLTGFGLPKVRVCLRASGPQRNPRPRIDG